MRTDTENYTQHTEEGEVVLCRVHTYRMRTDTEKLYPAYRRREVVLCRVHAYRMRTDTENYTQHTGEKRSGIMQSPYIQNENRY
ncbi:unnamed protein product [Staurois parvus]|uniref:Uncharacterized protein n=1 Tax=Staurois parvus TaxID=386267 RepID=A0ABN9HFM2_9NEOB|nr:unnamed protein product [Staurois parvus]